MNFFEDDEAARPSPPQPAERRTRSKRSLRVQRIVILLIAVFIVVFLLALLIRSCQHNRKVDDYRDYFSSLNAMIGDSNAVGRNLKEVIENPAKYTRKELRTKLNGMVKRQNDIASRAKVVAVPDNLSSQHELFAMGMAVRANGMRELRTVINTAIAGPTEQNGNRRIKVADLTALSGYFTGPDAFYTDLVYTQAQELMRQDGVSAVTVPKCTYYLTTNIFGPVKLDKFLDRIGDSASLSGIHGVAVTAIKIDPGNQTLQGGRNNQVKASADMVFKVIVANQGTVAEAAVPVTLSLKLPGSDKAQKKKSTIDSIKAGKSVTVEFSGFDDLPEGISRKSKLTATAGPVANERVAENNRLEFTIILTL